ncbi:LOW QUALITY PROTEIN: hypothetical protein ACHAXT_012522 [Thalassiosira profunda]
MRPPTLLLGASWALASLALPPAAACPFLQAAPDEREAMARYPGDDVHAHRRLDEHHDRSRLLDDHYRRKRKRTRKPSKKSRTSRKSKNTPATTASSSSSGDSKSSKASQSSSGSKAAKRAKSGKSAKAARSKGSKGQSRKPRRAPKPSGAPSPSSMLLRREDAVYPDGSHALDEGLPNPRAISNAFHSQRETEGSRGLSAAPILNSLGASDWLWVFGQFFNHDISEVNVVEGDYCNITVPEDDPVLTDVDAIPMSRSNFEMDDSNVAQQLTDMTSHVDGENVYGTTPSRLAYIRAEDSDATGRLRTSGNNLLPKNILGLPNRGPEEREQELFLAGDVRANENLGLLVAHTLFMREHNHWADYLRQNDPTLDGNGAFATARVLVRGILQKITYEEFLPSMPAKEAFRNTRGTNPKLIPASRTSCVFRVGHTLVGDTLAKDYGDGRVSHIPLQNAFFNPEEVEAEGLDPFLRGMATNQCHEVDPILAPALRNHLFSDQHDLMALNIQRTRDHGIPTFNDIRASVGLDRLESFEDFGFSEELASVYDGIDQIDCWVGMNSEPRLPGRMVGPTQQTILARNFANIRDGDPNYYKHSVADEELLELIEGTTFADVIRRNSDAPGSLDDIQENVFFVVEER